MGSWGILLLLLALILLRQPLIVLMGAITVYCYYFLPDPPLESFQELNSIIGDLFFAGDKEILLAIPLFIIAGNLMTHGSIARRLIRIAQAMTAPIPAGLAIAGVFSCGIFAAISGSSPVTLIAIGGLMYPSLTKAGYPTQFSMGLLASGGTLGIIIPPSIPMIVYAIMVGVSVTDLFIAGIGPGILLMSLLMIYSVLRAGNVGRGKWDWTEIRTAWKEGVLALLMPVVILGGIYSGFFTATESAAIAVFYAILVEVFIHKELSFPKIPKIMAESAEMLGILFLILILAVSLNKFMIENEIPQNLVATMSGLISSPVTFLIGVNVLLLIVGMFMDIMSAILVLAPLLAPMAVNYGINPVHFGIIMIVNLEIGYLTPPVGVNLFVASGIFKQPLGKVIQSVAPIVGLFLIGLILISWIPEISLGLVGGEGAAPTP
ncbi:TRAP transporter large permease [Leptospira perdikensis]|uniref:TRAP transporter large permease n=1 Tax=Leptospira perdikensis TaxID=2484948 RepID=A0A4R9JF83_9LEPT|nr:TRAP transporter large permease [Leptospira perdikensis]TGL37614.1 TRAP transporter large permease [Leptospira perdikensis]